MLMCRTAASATIGPQIGSASVDVAPAQTAGVGPPAGGTAFTGAVLSAGPSAPSAPLMPQMINPYGEFRPFHDQPAFDPSMFNSSPMPPHMQGPGPSGDFGNQSPSAPGGLPVRPGGIPMHPSRMAALGGPPPFNGMGSPVPPATGQIRPFDAIGSPGEDGQAKRPRIEKLPGGQYYPVRLTISAFPFFSAAELDLL